jgi:hypothetical protein
MVMSKGAAENKNIQVIKKRNVSLYIQPYSNIFAAFLSRDFILGNGGVNT